MTTEIRNNRDAGRYELLADNTVASIADYYLDSAGRIVFPHTETVPAFRGRGYAAQLVRAALDEARREGRSVVAACWFVAEFIDEHAEYGDLVGSR